MLQRLVLLLLFSIWLFLSGVEQKTMSKPFLHRNVLLLKGIVMIKCEYISKMCAYASVCVYVHVLNISMSTCGP